MTDKPDGGAPQMTDLTRAEIAEISIDPTQFSRELVAQAITQLLRQVDAETARADAAAGQMRERCAVMIETHALVYSNAPPKLVQSSRAVEDTHHKTIAAAIHALPLHEEPKT